MFVEHHLNARHAAVPTPPMLCLQKAKRLKALRATDAEHPGIWNPRGRGGEHPPDFRGLGTTECEACRPLAGEGPQGAAAAPVSRGTAVLLPPPPGPQILFPVNCGPATETVPAGNECVHPGVPIHKPLQHLWPTPPSIELLDMCPQDLRRDAFR